MNRPRHPLVVLLAVLALGSAILLATLAGAVSGVPPLLASASTGAPRLALSQIGEVAEQAGFSGAGLAMAIAVALAESGGDPLATDHDTNGTVDRGLWQINSVHRAYSAACDYAPSCAARAAYAISAHGRDWSPWVTYQRGEEIAYLPEAVSWVDQRAPVAAIGAGARLRAEDSQRIGAET